MPSALVAAMVIALEGCGQLETGQFSLGTLLTALVLRSPGLAYAGWQWQRYQQWRAIDPGQEYQQALDGWTQRAAWHQHAELTRLNGQPEWGSQTIPAGRTDVIGGTPAGWQALVAVHGASLLAHSPLLVIDFTGQDATSTLMALARRAGTEAVTWRLPQDLGRYGPPRRTVPGPARRRPRGTSTSRNWSQSWSGSDGTSWGDTQTRQRVYEYAIKPTALQNLPEYALLLADRTGGTLTMRAVECDLAIITFPGASTAPLPPPPGSIDYTSGPPGMHGQNPARPAVPPLDHTARWQEPPAEAPQPAQPPEEQPPPQPWWLRNQPQDPRR
jgi:hypothetical protein